MEKEYVLVLLFLLLSGEYHGQVLVSLGQAIRVRDTSIKYTGASVVPEAMAAHLVMLSCDLRDWMVTLLRLSLLVLLLLLLLALTVDRQMWGVGWTGDRWWGRKAGSVYSKSRFLSLVVCV